MTNEDLSSGPRLGQCNEGVSARLELRVDDLECQTTPPRRDSCRWFGPVAQFRGNRTGSQLHMSGGRSSTCIFMCLEILGMHRGVSMEDLFPGKREASASLRHAYGFLPAEDLPKLSRSRERRAV